MTLLSEIRRIVGKDLRVLRWPLISWCTLLVLSTLRGLDVLPALHDVLYPVEWIVPMMAAALVAYAVTQDPPQEGPTFWGVHHHRPMAVAGAKAVLLTMLLAAMTSGHALVLATHGLSAVQVGAMSADAARDAAAWLLFSAALAACARNAKGWLIGALLAGTLTVLVAVLATGESGMTTEWPTLTPRVAALTLIAISSAVLAWTYRAHLTGLRSGVRTALLLVGPAVMPVTRFDPMADLPTAAAQTDSALTVHADRIMARIEQRAVIVDVPVTYPDSSVVAAATVAWRLQLRDGSAVQLLPGGARVRRGATLLTPEANVALWGRGPVTRTLEFRYPLDSATLARVEGNLAAVTMALETDRVAMHRVTTFPVTQGGTVALDGTRLLIGAVDEGQFEARVSHVWIPNAISRIPWSAAYVARPILAVQTAPSGAVRVLEAQDETVAGRGATSGSWVLPGNTMRSRDAVLVPTGVAAPVTGNVVAYAGDYGGHLERAIRASAVR